MKQKLHPIFEKIEHYNSKLITPAIIVLLFIIAFELFIHTENHFIHSIVSYTDAVIVAIFVIELLFVAYRVRNVRIFFKKYWLDILAIFPFILFARFIRLFAAAEFGVSQSLLHESLEITKGASESGKLAKLTKISKAIRIGARFLRILSKAKRFFRQKAAQLKIGVWMW